MSKITSRTNKNLLIILVMLILSVPAGSAFAWDWLSGGDHLGANWTVNSSTQIAGLHYNINKFTLTQGATLSIVDYDGVHYGSVTIHAESIELYGMIDGDGCGYPGGAGGVLQSTDACGGFAGQDGSPAGEGGFGGVDGASSSTVSGSGAGGGGGGGYGGAGDGGSEGGINNPNGLSGGAGGNPGALRGAFYGEYIDMGSGGAGAGGGGAGNPGPAPGGSGGMGGAGGGQIELQADFITIKGAITVNGADGSEGGDGGGPATKSGGGGSGAGGGSGGGVLVYAGEDVLISTTAVISAGGGKCGLGGIAVASGGGAGNPGGSGGGGRVKIFYGGLEEYGSVEVPGGSYMGSNGSSGTVYRECLVLPLMQSFYPADDAYGIPVGSSVVVLFNQEMYEELTEGAISLYPVRDNLWNRLSTAPVAGNASYTTSGNIHKLVFNPGADLMHNYLYEVRLGTQAKGVINNNFSAQAAWSFRTRMDPGKDNSVVTADGGARLEVDSGTLPAGSYVVIGDADAAKIYSADSKIDADGKLQRIGKAREFLALDGGGDAITADFSGTAGLVFSYEDVNGDGFVDGTDPIVDERYLAVYWLNEDNDIWVRLDTSSVDTASDTVSADVAHFTVFSIIGALSGVVSGAYAFPVPYCPNDGDSDTGTVSGGITFTDLSSECSINVYTIAGETVKTIEVVPADMNIKNWNVKNGDGEDVFSGVYVYYIESDEENKSGKIIIIR